MTRCVIVSMNEKYALYFSVLLVSIIENAGLKDRYEIVVLHDDLPDGCRERLSGMLSKENSRSISLRFLNVHEQMEGYQFYVNGTSNRAYLSREAYFRLLAPHLLPEHKTALYLDCDIVVSPGWEEIFDMGLDGYLLAGIGDIWGNWECYDKNSKLYQYRQNELELENPLDYFNSGVMLLNLALMRSVFRAGELLEIAASREWQKHDQDVLNRVCRGKVLFLDYRWNMIECPGRRAKESVPLEEYRKYEACRETPRIIHYASRKPWIVKGVSFEQNFWAAAAHSAYFQELFTHFIEEQLSQGTCFEEKAFESIRAGKIGVKFIVRCALVWVKRMLRNN